MKNVFKWIKHHVRPYVSYKGTKKNGGDMDFSKDNFDKVKYKVEKYTEVGVKIKFKF